MIARARGKSHLRTGSISLSGWGAFSFVEAAVLLVAVGVLTLLFQRAEGRAFHLPGGDGGVVMLAGGWTCCLVIWRIFDKQGTTGQAVRDDLGIEWGIFIALAVAAFLAYAGVGSAPPTPPSPHCPVSRRPRSSATATQRPASAPGARPWQRRPPVPAAAARRGRHGRHLDPGRARVPGPPSERPARATTHRRPRSLGEPDDSPRRRRCPSPRTRSRGGVTGSRRTRPRTVARLAPRLREPARPRRRRG